ncbi:glycosyltransferase [Oscillibacter valericigenes]|uniref:glycosyltransferase family 4 protein n=1 Tax=Oscillibacter valericigenes TaxID=351091 RepID=UPI001F30C93C|nr:glycosyltransferase [Oscillibacter valericigenes]MCF2615833.1 glycosyltransferase [Oscillibacter valericigenes]
MSIYLYRGGEKLVGRSGVGQAIRHQAECLSRCGLPVTDRFAPDTDAVHINTVLPDAVVTALLARLRGRKVVWYGHSTMEDFRGSFRGSDLLAPLFRRWLTFCYGLGDVVLTPTPYSRRLLAGYGLRKPVYSLSNGVDVDFFHPDAAAKDTFRKRYHLGANEKTVISVGHTIARKGLPEFLELARRMPDVRFLWFGWTDPRLVPAAITRAIRNAPPNVLFPGFVDRERLREAYQGADVFAFLSHEETEGIVVLEALACGIPTVLRDIPVYDGWLEDRKTVYKASNPGEFQRIVMDLLAGTLPDLTAAGRQAAEERSLEAVGERLKDIYRKERILPPLPAPLKHRRARA